jgi:hypothetical protein
MPARLRRIAGSFAFFSHRFLRDGFLQSLTAEELRLYLVLVLVADRDGHFFYLHQRLCALLDTSPDAYLQARDALLRKDLIAASDTRVQVLSLSAKPIHIEASPLPRRDQIAVCEALLTGLSVPNRK